MAIARTAATGSALDSDFLAWSSSLPIDCRLLRVDCQGSIAHVEGLRRAGLVTAAEADVLVRALEGLPDRVERGEVVLPAEEDVHMAVEAWLHGEVGAVADKLHTGRSRNDQVATDLKLWCRSSVTRLEDAIERVVRTAREWCHEHGDHPMPAYTHRQVAIPVLAWIWMDAAVRRGLVRDRELLAVVRAELVDSPLGAGAVGGTTLPLVTDETAAALGFGRGPVNPVDAVGDRDFALSLAFACARISLHLARFASDVVELASDGLCRLGGSIACGSSMMPHKRNPDLFELLRGTAALRHGELSALLATFHGLGSGYHRDLQQDKELLFRAVDGTCSALDMAVLGIRGLSLDPKACLRALAEGDAIATDLTERLVEGGMPFRAAYQAIGALVARQRGAGKRLVDVTPDDLRAVGLPVELTAQLDLAAAARRRAARFQGAADELGLPEAAASP